MGASIAGPPPAHFHPVTHPAGTGVDLRILPGTQRRVAHVTGWDPRAVEVAAGIASMIRGRRPDLAVEHIGEHGRACLPGKGIVDLSIEVDPCHDPGGRGILYGLGFGPQPGPDPWPPTRPMLVGAVELDGDEFRIDLHVQPAGGRHAPGPRLPRRPQKRP